MKTTAAEKVMIRLIELLKQQEVALAKSRARLEVLQDRDLIYKENIYFREKLRALESILTSCKPESERIQEAISYAKKVRRDI